MRASEGLESRSNEGLGLSAKREGEDREEEPLRLKPDGEPLTGKLEGE